MIKCPVLFKIAHSQSLKASLCIHKVTEKSEVCPCCNLQVTNSISLEIENKLILITSTCDEHLQLFIVGIMLMIERGDIYIENNSLSGNNNYKATCVLLDQLKMQIGETIFLIRKGVLAGYMQVYRIKAKVTNPSKCKFCNEPKLQEGCTTHFLDYGMLPIVFNTCTNHTRILEDTIKRLNKEKTAIPVYDVMLELILYMQEV